MNMKQNGLMEIVGYVVSAPQRHEFPNGESKYSFLLQWNIAGKSRPYMNTIQAEVYSQLFQDIRDLSAGDMVHVKGQLKINVRKIDMGNKEEKSFFPLLRLRSIEILDMADADQEVLDGQDDPYEED